jgi:hypothetical protein
VKGLLALLLALVLGFARSASATDLVTLPAHGRIDVKAEPGLEATAHELASQADVELASIALDLVDLPTPQRIHLQVVRDSSSLASVSPDNRGAPSWAIGVAYPDLAVISIALRRGGAVADARQTLRHELAHVALAAALGDRAPHWLHEGFAYQHSAEASWDRMETLAGMAWFGGIFPIEELDQHFPAEEAPANRAYAESYDFVGYLARRGRWEDNADLGDRWPFRAFLRAIGQGKDLDHAAISSFGKPLHALFDEWKDSLSKRYLFAPIGLLGLALWILCAMLLAIAFWRRRRANRRRMAQWDREERAADERRQHSQSVVAPPYVPWPGEDPFEEQPDDDDPEVVN